MADGARTGSAYVWRPGPGYVEQANVQRLIRRHALAGIDELRARSVQDVAWYWAEVVRDLELPFRRPFSRVLDLSGGVEFPEWFVDGEVNVVDACLGRWVEDPDTRDRAAVVHENESGAVRTLTFAELDERVARAAAGLRAAGISRGDAVALYLPMVPEAVVALYAAARIGAVVVPLFSGFAPAAIAARLRDAQARAVVVADGTVRRGAVAELAPAMAAALRECPQVRLVVAVTASAEGPEALRTLPGVTCLTWDRLLAHDPDPRPPVPVSARDPFLLAYTSGTTGRPKGAVHTQPGFLVKTAAEVAYSFDLKPGGVFCWITDMGWIMGPLSIIGAHANGAALLLYEGLPDVPGPHRLWELAARHRVTMLGVSPTLIRALRSGPPVDPGRYDLSCVHTLGSTGEPWDVGAYDWLARDVFGGRVPIINFSGGTEVGGSFLAPYPVEPIRSCSLGGPSLGMDVDVVDAAGTSVRGAVGELVCRQPWPSMTRGVWRDPERYLEAYWSTFPGIWRHGDHALVAEDGQWYLLGRSDDVMNVAGKRLAPAEVESVLTGHPAVAEAAVVGVPDDAKGEAVVAFWVPRAGVSDPQALAGQLRATVAGELGRPFAPSRIYVVPRLPKTRSAKIMRRAVRAVLLGQDPGDLSGAEDPTALDDIRLAITSKDVAQQQL